MTEGFEFPIFRSLTERILLGGVPRNFAILNGALAAAAGLYLHSWLALGICLAFYLGARIAAKKDPFFYEVFLRHLNTKKIYFV